MPPEEDTSSGPEPTRRLHLDAPALLACLLASLAALGCLVLATVHGYRFVVLLLDRGHITARNAQLFAACGWLAGALVLGFGCGVLVRLMYRINGTVAPPADVVAARPDAGGRTTDGSGRRR